MSARAVKLALASENQACVYLDAAFEIIRPGFMEFMIGNLSQHDCVFLKHPQRNCLYDEIEICLTIPKCNHDDLHRQRDRYLAAGMPSNYGLWATGCFAFRNTALARELRRLWWAEMIQSSNRDQVSLPYIVWQNRFEPFIKTIELDVFDNSYVKWFHHNP